MRLLDFIEERAKRRERRFLRLLEAGHPTTILDRLPGWPSAQFIIAGAILAMFAGAYIGEPDRDTRNLMVGALIAAFAGAWGYFLGSSNSAKTAGDRTDVALGIVKDANDRLPTPPSDEPDVTLKPGDKVEVGAEKKDD